jgi:hypothetical protein
VNPHDVGSADPPRGVGAPRPAYACDCHLARWSPLCDALGGLDWSKPVVWFHDFGLLPLDGGLQLRLGAAPPVGATAPIRALSATLWVPGSGAIATQDFPLAPYVHRERDAASAISLSDEGGRFAFVRGPARAPLVDADRRRLMAVCRAIEAWAALLSGGELPRAGVPSEIQSQPGPVPAAGGGAGQERQGERGDQEPLVVMDEAEEPSGAS